MSYPFVIPRSAIISNISLPAVQVFKDSTYSCWLDAIRLVNQTSNPIMVTLSVIRSSVETIFQPPLTLQANSVGYAQMDAPYWMEAGDALYAYSDSASNSFNAFITYRQLQEITTS